MLFRYIACIYGKCIFKTNLNNTNTQRNNFRVSVSMIIVSENSAGFIFHVRLFIGKAYV